MEQTRARCSFIHPHLGREYMLVDTSPQLSLLDKIASDVE